MNTVALVVVLVFVAVFAVTALLLAASQAGASKALKETLERLDSVTIAARRNAGEESVLVKREELLSNVPWIDRALRRIDLFGRARLLLQQAEVKWTVGGLCAATFGCWGAAAALVYLRTGEVIPSVLLGAVGCAIPWAYVLRARARRF
jgi:Flp pilus assembly protein TadB